VSHPATQVAQFDVPRTKARFPLPEFTATVHGPSWRPMNSGAFFDTRVDGPSWRVSKNAPELRARQLGPWTRAINSGAFFDTRQLGPSTQCQKMHPSSRAVNLARQLGPWKPGFSCGEEYFNWRKNIYQCRPKQQSTFVQWCSTVNQTILRFFTHTHSIRHTRTTGRNRWEKSSHTLTNRTARKSRRNPALICTVCILHRPESPSCEEHKYTRQIYTRVFKYYSHPKT